MHARTVTLDDELFLVAETTREAEGGLTLGA